MAKDLEQGSLPALRFGDTTKVESRQHSGGQRNGDGEDVLRPELHLADSQGKTSVGGGGQRCKDRLGHVYRRLLPIRARIAAIPDTKHATAIPSIKRPRGSTTRTATRSRLIRKSPPPATKGAAAIIAAEACASAANARAFRRTALRWR